MGPHWACKRSPQLLVHATMANVPARCFCRPTTRRATNSCPARAWLRRKRSLNATLIVLSDTCIRARKRLQEPPREDDRLKLPNRQPAWKHRIAGKLRHRTRNRAPSLRSASARSRVRLYTVTRCTAAAKLFASVPILPSPLNPPSIASYVSGRACVAAPTILTRSPYSRR